ncbi:hypothetical protein SAMN05192588_0537 [Nonlabens sp. Hel1_33_55]|nr:hypothetical protein SAMN05192588_0537 [Nonlabens sp. Hel1_33_55]
MSYQIQTLRVWFNKGEIQNLMFRENNYGKKGNFTCL